MKYTDVSSLNIGKNSSRRGWGMENWIRETIPCTTSSLHRKKVSALTFQRPFQSLELMNPKVSSPSPFQMDHTYKRNMRDEVNISPVRNAPKNCKTFLSFHERLLVFDSFPASRYRYQNAVNCDRTDYITARDWWWLTLNFDNNSWSTFNSFICNNINSIIYNHLSIQNVTPL